MADEPWQALAELVRRRREERRMSQRDLATAAGTTDRLISSIERAERTTYKPRLLRDIAASLGWTPDSIQAILGGGAPTDAQPPSQPTMAERLAKLEHELAALKAELAARDDPNGGSSARSA